MGFMVSVDSAESSNSGINAREGVCGIFKGIEFGNRFITRTSL
jgi:hypothetical protein